MFRFDRLVIAVVLVGVTAVAWGRAVKIPSFVIEASRLSCDGTFRDITLNPNADGMAILNYAGGARDKTIVQVILSDFTGDPNLNGLYFLRLNAGDGGDGIEMGMFLVGKNGNGHFHGEVSGDRSGSNVELWAQPGPCSKVLIARGG